MDTLYQTGIMFISRIFFFHLYESPRYLVHSGKHREAFLVLEQIVKVNGDTFEVGIEDVWDKLVGTRHHSPQRILDPDPQERLIRIG